MKAKDLAKMLIVLGDNEIYVNKPFYNQFSDLEDSYHKIIGIKEFKGGKFELVLN